MEPVPDMNPPGVLLEVCAGSVASGIAAQRGGAERIELCANLSEGGTTPSPGTIRVARRSLEIQIYPIIRPRGGDFLYGEKEFEVMKEDILHCRQAGCEGIATGVLLADGSVDLERLAVLVETAWPMGVTFHRAFDLVADPFRALEGIIASGCERILTSGQAPTAPEGAGMIASLIRAAAGRIIIMPGAGIREENMADLVRATGAREFHSSARTRRSGGMAYRKPGLSMGSSDNEKELQETDEGQVSGILRVAREAAKTR